jgi:hypothetical protein
MFDANKPSRGPRAVVPALTNDPLAHCDPLGYPRNLYVNERSFELVPTPHKVWQIFEWARANREIWTDGRKIPDDPDPRWYGWAVGKWDGDAFVVDSTGYEERAWLDSEGYPHSEDMKMHEVYHHPDAYTLDFTMTIDDAKVYTQPIAGGKQTYKLQVPKDLTILAEDYCVPSEEESFNQGVRNPAGGVISKK